MMTSSPNSEQIALRENAINGSPSDKFKYVRSLRFSHRNLDAVRKRVRQNADADGLLSITIVAGPAGVGKSIFSKIFMDELLSLHKKEIQEDPGVIPVVWNEIDAPDGKQINWQLFYQSLLSDLLTLTPDCVSKQVSNAKSARIAVQNNRVMLEASLVERKVRYIILDEVVHLTDSKTPPLEYGNLLKSLANGAGLNLILIGAYGSEKLVDVSGQLTRRLEVVEFPRYRTNQRDFDAFAVFIKEFESHIPLPFKVSLEKYVQPLFESHLGLPGYASQTLANAIRRCAHDDAKRWRDDFMWAEFPSDAAHNVIAMETFRGEEAIKPYLKTTNERTYPSHAEIRARIVEQRMTEMKQNGKRRTKK
jgi:hypothetical protein